MSQQDNSLQELKIFITEADRYKGKALYLTILELVKEQHIAGATAVRGLAGYSENSRQIHTGNLVDVAPRLPVVIYIVDGGERIARLLPLIEAMVSVSGGLITVQDIEAHRYLHPNLSRELKVEQVMERNVVTVRPDMPVAEILPLLLGKFYKALPVVDQDGRVAGIITDGDLLEKAGIPFRLSVIEALQQAGEHGVEELLASLRASNRTALDIMNTRPLVVASPTQSVREVARLMVEQGVKRVPVVDGQGRLVGIIGRRDVLKLAGQVFPTSAAEGGEAGGHTLGDVMSEEVLTVGAGTPAREVLDKLGSVPGARRVVVVDGDGRPIGIITDTDLVRRALPQNRPGLMQRLFGGSKDAPLQATNRTVADLMTPNPVVAPATANIAAAVGLMVERGVKVLPVVDKDGRLVGIVNRTRLLGVLIQHHDLPERA